MEYKRVLVSKAFLGLLAALVLFNVIFYLYMRPNTWAEPRIDGEVYHEQLEALSGQSWEDALQWCISYQDEANQMGYEQQWTFDSKEQQLVFVARELQGQYEHLLGYNDYLNKIQREVKRLQTVSLFSDPKSVAYQNTAKTARDFPEAVTVTTGRDLAVTTFFEDKWTDYSILLVMCLVCGLFAAERKEGLWSMIHAAPGGRGRLAMKRTGILFAAAWISSFVLIGSKLLLCNWEYHGFHEWGRMIQSIPMFGNVPTPMTVGQFWGLYITVKALGAFWIGLVLWAVLSVIADLGLALCAAGGLMAAEFACTAIPSNSIFAPARYVNVFSYVDFQPVFTRYLNIRVFGTLIQGSDLVLVLLPVLCLTFVGLNVWITVRKYPIAPTNRILRWADSVCQKTNPVLAGGGESRKLLIKRKGILLLVLLAIFVFQMDAPPRTRVDYDPLIQYYQQKYVGPITNQKLDTMEEELAYILGSPNGEGLQRVIDDAKAAPAGAWIMPTAPYDAIWSNNEENYHRTTALVVMLILVLILSPIASQEKQSNMTTLLRTTAGGRKRLLLKKQLLILSIVAVVWTMVYGMEIYHTVTEYGDFTCLNAPAYSLKLFRWMPLPVLWAVVLYYLAKLPVLAAVGEACFLLSGRCNQNRTAILLCCGVLVLPAALGAVGSVFGEYLSFLLPLGGAELLHLIGG